MALPQALQQQVEQAEALQQQLYGNTEPAPAAEPPVVEAAPVTEPAAAPEPTNVVELKPSAEPAPLVETPPKPAVDNTKDAAYWKQRFDTVSGVLNAEVPRLTQRLKEQDRQLAELQSKLQEKPVVEPTPQAAPAQDTDVDDFGPDLVSMVSRKAEATINRVLARALDDFRREIGAVKAQVGQVSEQFGQSETQKFWQGVMNLVPDWAAVDSNPEWVSWLNTAPAFSKRSYRQLATEAIEANDPEAIKALVIAWRGEAPASVAAPVETPSPASSELQRQVTPSNSRSSAPAQPAERVWSRADYEAAMDVRNVTRYGKPEADRLEAEATRAVAEGRVRW